ncbi:ATP-binding protein [Microbispora triticiradicis]|uniref:ATP-binding protein n=2 Tax=Microbispora TaxID=2005 RepID=A0ABY3LQJ8_9ACTN|nr:MULTISPECIES: ATP-binding protein [Microbispora]TLP66525.1 ATP-binding protein [Microbispora fusca]TYB47418.1 ATP-binding protein [Microbispora tritici]
MTPATRTRAQALALPGEPESVSAARAFATGCLPAGCPRADDVALVVSELATNAVLHSRSGDDGGTFVVLIDVEPGAVAVAVADAGPALVPGMRPEGEDEHGRGLALVADLADAYEVTTTETGRTAWVRLDWDTTTTGVTS